MGRQTTEQLHQMSITGICATEIHRGYVNLNVHCRWMDKEDVVHIYNGILHSQKKEGNNAICSNKDATRYYHTYSREISQKEKDKYHMI